METRRSFIKKSIIAGTALLFPLSFPANSPANYPELKTRNPKKIIILWYSQTGQTRRYARLIACILKEKGFAVDISDIRKFDKNLIPDYDLVIFGTPVFYYDTPSNIIAWLEEIPPVPGTAVAAFVSFGGPEGNQFNAASHILKLFADKGGVPVGREAFRNIASYPTPRWDSKNQLAGKHLPDAATFESVRRFTADTVDGIKQGRTIPVDYEFAVRELLALLPLVWLNKKAITRHTVDAKKCVGCNTCVEKCPVHAIDPYKQTVDRHKCLACFGCLNNCPVNAVVMEYRGEPLYGFQEYVRRSKITIMEPPELKSCALSG